MPSHSVPTKIWIDMNQSHISHLVGISVNWSNVEVNSAGVPVHKLSYVNDKSMKRDVCTR